MAQPVETPGTRWRRRSPRSHRYAAHPEGVQDHPGPVDSWRSRARRELPARPLDSSRPRPASATATQHASAPRSCARVEGLPTGSCRPRHHRVEAHRQTPLVGASASRGPRPRRPHARPARPRARAAAPASGSFGRAPAPRRPPAREGRACRGGSAGRAPRRAAGGVAPPLPGSRPGTRPSARRGHGTCRGGRAAGGCGRGWRSRAGRAEALLERHQRGLGDALPAVEVVEARLLQRLEDALVDEDRYELLLERLVPVVAVAQRPGVDQLPQAVGLAVDGRLSRYQTIATGARRIW